MAGKHKWFAHPKSPNNVKWWVKAGQTPTLTEAKEKLALLAANGPSVAAFNFKDCYTPLGQNFVWNMPEKDCA